MMLALCDGIPLPLQIDDLAPSVYQTVKFVVTEDLVLNDWIVHHVVDRVAGEMQHPVKGTLLQHVRHAGFVPLEDPRERNSKAGQLAHGLEL